jgi:hypothetical protein
MPEFPVDRYMRSVRRLVDLSQREFALRAGVPHFVVANVERNPRLARVTDFAQLIEAVGMRLVVVDDKGREVAPEEGPGSKLRDRGRRRFPAHLDVREGKDDWWGDGWPMFQGKTPQYTFDRSRWYRDWRRERTAREVEQTEQAGREPERNAAPGGLARGEVRGDEFGDLDGVERGALAEVVIADEQGEPA